MWPVRRSVRRHSPNSDSRRAVSSRPLNSRQTDETTSNYTRPNGITHLRFHGLVTVFTEELLVLSHAGSWPTVLPSASARFACFWTNSRVVPFDFSRTFTNLVTLTFQCKIANTSFKRALIAYRHRANKTFSFRFCPPSILLILDKCRSPHRLFNLLKPTGHVMHQQFNIQQLYVLPTLYLCVLYLSENKERLRPLTAQTDWFL